MHANRFVRVRSPGVLHRIRVDGQLMHLPEEDEVAVLGAMISDHTTQHSREQLK